MWYLEYDMRMRHTINALNYNCLSAPQNLSVKIQCRLFWAENVGLSKLPRVMNDSRGFTSWICKTFSCNVSKDRWHVVFILSWNLTFWDFIFGMHMPLMMPYEMTPNAKTLTTTFLLKITFRPCGCQWHSGNKHILLVSSFLTEPTNFPLIMLFIPFAIHVYVIETDPWIHYQLFLVFDPQVRCFG